MEENKKLTIEDKIYNLFQFALKDDGTTITFYNQLDNFKDVVMLGHYGIAISIFRTQIDENYYTFSDKWKSKFPKIYNMIVNYNTLTNNSTTNEIPVDYELEELEDMYDDIFDAIQKKYTKINRYLYGEPWITSKRQRSLYYIKLNQLSYEISKTAYENLLSLSVEEEKYRNNELVDDLISQYVNAESELDDTVNIDDDIINKQLGIDGELNIDDLLDKISESGFESLNDVEIEFLRNNKKNE